MYVYQGSRLVYVATYDNDLLTRLALTPGQMLSNIASDLANLHNIIVESSKNDLSIFTAQVNYTLNLLVNDSDYNSEQDVRSIVDHYFWLESGGDDGGTLPNGSRIVSVKPPNGQTQNTGAPDAPPDDPSKKPPSWLDELLSKIEVGSVGVIVGVAAVIGIVIFVSVREAV